MFSRYDKMGASTKSDPADKQEWPDPLTLDYTGLQLTEMPKRRELSSADLSRFWLYMVKQYSVAEGDDILLSVNGVPYRGMLRAGDPLYLISYSDIQSAGIRKQPGA